MHHTLIMVVGADLAYADDGTVVPGPDTAQVCDTAVEIYTAMRDAGVDVHIIMTAGESTKYGVVMGAGTMRSYLVHSGVYPDRIYSPVAETFRTTGEMQMLARFMREQIQKEPDDTFDIYLIARWWHYPRARWLLHAQLEPWQRVQTTVTGVPTAARWTWKDLVREYGFAYARNIPDLFATHALEDCAWCSAQECYDLFSAHCHRCKKHAEVLPFKRAI